MPSKPPRTPPPHPARAGLGLLLACLLTLALAAPARAASDSEPKAGPAFDAFAEAWRAGSDEKVTDLMEPKKAVSFRLLEYPLSGKTRSMRPAQAKATLKAYFKRLTVESLKDVTPKRSPETVRIYDFTYKPTGQQKRTTRLQVQLKQDGKRRWVLASVTESPKR